MSSNGTKLYNVNELPAHAFLGYEPSLALAWTALALFVAAAALVALIVELCRRWRFMHAITFTGLCEAGGYAALVYTTMESGKGSVYASYVAMQVLIILSPNIIQGTQYYELGMVLRHCPDLVRGRRMLRGWVITLCFVSADLTAVVIQAIGISIWATSQSSGNPNQNQIKLGSIITLVGLGAQLLFSVCFTALTIWVHRHRHNLLRPRRQLWVGLYLTISFLYVRNIFRFVEFLQSTLLSWPPPQGTYVLAHKQVLFYCLDCLPILLVFASFIIFHPSRLLPKPGDADAIVTVEQSTADGWAGGPPPGAVLASFPAQQALAAKGAVDSV